MTQLITYIHATSWLHTDEAIEVCSLFFVFSAASVNSDLFSYFHSYIFISSSYTCLGKASGP